jgi:hypothetical protein
MTTTLTQEQEQAVHDAHWALEARGRGKAGIHSTTEACRVIRDLLAVIEDVTGIGAADPALPFGGAS